MESQQIRPLVNVTASILLLSVAVLAQKPTPVESPEDKPPDTTSSSSACDTGGAKSTDVLT